MAAPKGNKYAVGNKGGRPLKYPDPAAFDKMVDDFFIDCDNTDHKPTIEHLAVYMGCNHETLNEYANRSEEFSAAVKKAKQRCLDWLIADGLNARNPAMHIFLAKNNYGYRDKQEIESTVNVNVSQAIQAARNRAKVVNTVDISQLEQ